MKRPFESYVLYGLLIVLSGNAFYGGGTMIIRPDGSLIGMSTDWLAGSPFTNFLLPGIILLLLMGVFPVITLIGLTGRFGRRKTRVFEALNMYPEKHWSWTYSLYSGFIAIIWIIVQQLLAEFFILQPLISAIGVLIIIVTLLPRIQRFYSIVEKSG